MTYRNTLRRIARPAFPLTTIAVVAVALVSGAHAAPRGLANVYSMQSGTQAQSQSQSQFQTRIQIPSQTRSGGSGDSSAPDRRTERAADVYRVRPAQPARMDSRVDTRMISGNIDGRDIEIRIANGKVFARVDGVEIDPERIKMQGGRTTILNEDGSVLHELTMGWAYDPMPHGQHATELLERMRVQGAPARRVDGLQPGAPAPRAMLGVHLDDPSEAIQSHLGLLRDSATIITFVIDGLAAAEAGLQPHDVIISVDGRRPANPSMLREMVAASDPGTTLRLEVIRGGVVREASVRLVDFQRSRMVAPLADDAIDQALRARLGNLNVDILHDVDDRMRRHLFLASGEAKIDGEGPPNEVKDLKTRVEMIFQAVPGQVETFPQGIYGTGSAARNDRLQALEATVQTLAARIDRLVELMEKPTRE